MIESSTAALPETPETAGPTQISIIIPTRNEERHLPNCLRSLANLDFPHDQFEVLVVDNGSTDSTREVADSFTDELNIRMFVRPNIYISALRNFGASVACGTYLAFVDADCVVPPNWLRLGVLHLAEKGPGIIGAHYRIPADSTRLAVVWDRHQIAAKVGHVRYVPAGDLMIDRKTFFNIGGFDESIQTNEDAELCERIRAAGLCIFAFPELAVIHYGTPQSITGFYRKQRWHGTHVFKVFLRDFPYSANVRVVIFALFILACELGIILGILTGLVMASWSIFYISAISIVLPALVLSAMKVLDSRAWSDFPVLALLYFTYGIARARCLLSVNQWMLLRSKTPSQ